MSYTPEPSWWQMPGPLRFVEEAAAVLEQGQNLVLCLPEHCAPGLREAVQPSARRLGRFWHRLDAAGADDPVNFLYHRCVPQPTATTVWDEQTLCQEDGFAGHLIWLDGVTETHWPAWRNFLSAYQHHCRCRSELDRTLFCVPLEGSLALTPPKADVCLQHLFWYDRVAPLDMLLYASLLWRKHALAPLLKQVVIALTAHLALFDPTLAERLAGAPLATLLAPQTLLRELAEARGWTRDIQHWVCGAADCVEGEAQYHSAFLALLEFQPQLRQRLWSAQVGVVFPTLERFRLAWIEYLGEFLPATLPGGDGSLKDRLELEFGQIYWQVSNSGLRYKPEIWEPVQRLRELRNALAHGEPLDPTQLGDLAAFPPVLMPPFPTQTA